MGSVPEVGFSPGEGRGRNSRESSSPPWLKPLLETSFFASCPLHAQLSHKSECNLFCLQCTGAGLCASCLPAHKNHHVVQIRRSSYHDVIRVSEIQKVLDITSVQTYIINNARVVFLNERPQLRTAKSVSNACERCERSLLGSFRFCSLGCKLEQLDDELTFMPRQQPPEAILCPKKVHRSKKLAAANTSTLDEASVTHVPSGKRRKGIPKRAPFCS